MALGWGLKLLQIGAKELKQRRGGDALRKNKGRDFYNLKKKVLNKLEGQKALFTICQQIFGQNRYHKKSMMQSRNISEVEIQCFMGVRAQCLGTKKNMLAKFYKEEMKIIL